jgi:hypothetical protein
MTKEKNIIYIFLFNRDLIFIYLILKVIKINT